MSEYFPFGCTNRMVSAASFAGTGRSLGLVAKVATQNNRYIQKTVDGYNSACSPANFIQPASIYSIHYVLPTDVAQDDQNYV